MEKTKIHTDMPRVYWIDRLIPKASRPYVRLMRLDRPIGIWLLLLPCWWGTTLASTPQAPDPYLMGLFAIGAIVMRGAGCAINDIYDRRLDAAVERTRDRPLAQGTISLKQAWAFVGLLFLLGLGVLSAFNGPTIHLGIASLPLVFAYPLAKRVTWWPQLILGLAFNWGALMGWTAARGGFLEAPALILYAAGLFWTLGYDTIYAHQDKKDDARHGIKSSALRLEGIADKTVALFYSVFFLLLTLSGIMSGMETPFYILLFGAELYAVIMLTAWDPASPEGSLKAFRRNRDLGLIVWAAFLAGGRLSF